MNDVVELREAAARVYGELRRAGYSHRQVVAIIGELVGHLTTELRAGGDPCMSA